MKKYMVVWTSKKTHDEWVELETDDLGLAEALKTYKELHDRHDDDHSLELREMVNEYDYNIILPEEEENQEETEMKTMYEVERVNTDAKGIITYADSWGKESTLVDSYEEALKVVEGIDARGYDEVLINKLTLEYDEEWDEIIEVADSEQVESYKVNRHGFAVTEKKVYVVNHVINAQANDRGMSDRVETLIETEDEVEARKLYEAQDEGYELIAEVREWLIGADDYDITDEEVIDEK